MPLSKSNGNIEPPVQAKHQRRKVERPGELLDAALDLFVEKGFAATHVEEIAKLADVVDDNYLGRLEA